MLSGLRTGGSSVSLLLKKQLKQLELQREAADPGQVKLAQYRGRTVLRKGRCDGEHIQAFCNCGSKLMYTEELYIAFCWKGTEEHELPHCKYVWPEAAVQYAHPICKVTF